MMMMICIFYVADRVQDIVDGETTAEEFLTELNHNIGVNARWKRNNPEELISDLPQWPKRKKAVNLKGVNNGKAVSKNRPSRRNLQVYLCKPSTAAHGKISRARKDRRTRAVSNGSEPASKWVKANVKPDEEKIIKLEPKEQAKAEADDAMVLGAMLDDMSDDAESFLKNISG